MVNFLKNIFKSKQKGIGLEISTERLNIVQLKKQGQIYKLATYVSEPVPEGIFEEGKIVDAPALAELIQSTLASHNISVKQVTAAVPMREAIIRLIPIPAELDEAELRDMVLNHEASLYLPYPREEVDLDYQKLGFFQDEDGIEKVQVLLVATRRDVTDTYVETIVQAGLEMNILEINSFALLRTIREQLRQFSSQEAVVLVDIEFDCTEIAIVVDGVPQFSRTVPIGASQLQNALSRAMNLPAPRDIELLQGMTIPNIPMEGARTGATGINPGMAALLRVLGELADELRRSIDFYLNQSGDLEVAQLMLAGPGGGISQLDEFFTQRLSIPTIQIDPFEALSIEVDEDISKVQRPGLGTVLGLGLREV
ncbi:MAG: type IV pilus biogenesis protein PilM [Synechococcus sp.]|nr:type IV pilus biogenesis protein PilM [Synechococcus sp.]